MRSQLALALAELTLRGEYCKWERESQPFLPRIGSARETHKLGHGRAQGVVVSELGLDDDNVPLEVLELSVFGKSASAERGIRRLPVVDEYAIVGVASAALAAVSRQRWLIAHPAVRAADAHRIIAVIVALVGHDAIPAVLHVAHAPRERLLTQACRPVVAGGHPLGDEVLRASLEEVGAAVGEGEDEAVRSVATVAWRGHRRAEGVSERHLADALRTRLRPGCCGSAINEGDSENARLTAQSPPPTPPLPPLVLPPPSKRNMRSSPADTTMNA